MCLGPIDMLQRMHRPSLFKLVHRPKWCYCTLKTSKELFYIFKNTNIHNAEVT